MDSEFFQDPLVGLAINPGPREVVMPSAEELRALGPQWIRILLKNEFQDFETGQNTELDFALERYPDCDVLVIVNPETLGAIPPPHNEDWGNADAGYIGRVADLAQKIAGFYRGKIGALEVFNEPDIQELVPEDYGRLLAACYPKIKAANDLPVISAGILSVENFDYLERLIASARGAFDGVGWHPYGERIDGYPTPDWGFGELRRSLTRARAIAGKPLWLTEIGANLDYTWQPNLAPADAVAEYLTRAFALLRELGTDIVARAFWFTWRIPGEGWGLVDESGNRRAAWHAFQQQTRQPRLPAVTIHAVSFKPTTVTAGQLLKVSITIGNNSSVAVFGGKPSSGFIYNEGETFATRGFADAGNAFRVGIDFEDRAGVDHPYRWGWDGALTPGQSKTITGAIRLINARAQKYWAGIVREQVAWLEDQRGAQTITVKKRQRR